MKYMQNIEECIYHCGLDLIWSTADESDNVFQYLPWGCDELHTGRVMEKHRHNINVSIILICILGCSIWVFIILGGVLCAAPKYVP